MAQVETAAPAEISGLQVLSDKDARFQKRMVLLVTLGPFIGFLVALATLWGRGLSPLDLGLFLFFYFFTGLGVTIGFHRSFTHKSFEAVPFVRAGLALAGSMAVQGSVISWVADHRRHHAFSDQKGDPHSPHLEEGEGFFAIIKGLWHAHMGWFFSPERTDRERWAPDIMKDPMMRRIDRMFPPLTIISFFLPGLIGLAVTRTWQGGLTALLWGGVARIFFLHHVTWSVNSICHFYGERPFATTDFSTNNWLLSIISFGESWHNNHHAFPTSAIHGLGRWQFDMSGKLIRLMERLGLATRVKYVSAKQMAAKMDPRGYFRSTKRQHA